MKFIRNLTKAAMIFSLLGVVMGGILLVACQPNVDKSAEAKVEETCPVPKEIAAMDSYENTAVIPSVSIPPIDASAPAKTETATFSLG